VHSYQYVDPHLAKVAVWFYFSFLGIMIAYFNSISLENGYTYTHVHYRTLIGSHTLPIKRNHHCADPMTGSAWNCRRPCSQHGQIYRCDVYTWTRLQYVLVEESKEVSHDNADRLWNVGQDGNQFFPPCRLLLRFYNVAHEKWEALLGHIACTAWECGLLLHSGVNLLSAGYNNEPCKNRDVDWGAQSNLSKWIPFK